MTESSRSGPKVRIRKARFPWPSTLAGLATVAYLLFLNDIQLRLFYELPAAWFSERITFAVLGAFFLLLLFDLRRFHRRYRIQTADLKALGRQMDELWQRNRELQLKAHTYSGHADKLKLFISDKLLEYIEYDEKFLHFKGIAAEVRHNGVISFDKVQTALQGAAESARAGKEDEAGRKAADDYQSALDAMRYLWDLLDLSTADNLAIHIGNLLCECEEHYCQRLLNPDALTPLPYEPAYSPQLAAWRALSLVRPDPPPRPDGQDDYHLADEQFHVQLAAAGELLGNENHLVLLLDNLLKNAQFFSRKRSGQSDIPPIALSLLETRGQARFRVYNRGPHIQEEDPARLFQLGYSTRRSREHHGRGLGLYFVNEIVKGYEGSIQVHNIHSPEAQYELTLTLANGDVLTRMLDVSLDADGRPQCEPQDEDETGATRSREWTLPAPLAHMEVSADHSATRQLLDGFEARGKQRRLDPGHPGRPHWRISYLPRRRNPRLSFEPLDINGVEVEVLLPTARQRLDSGEAALNENLDAEMERLDERFGEPLK